MTDKNSPQPPGEITSFRHGALEDTTHTQRVAGAPRVEGDGITYGRPVEINLDNIDKLGMKNHVETFWMDEKGRLAKDSLEKGFSSDFPEKGARDFLHKFGMDTGAQQEYATPTFMMQRVEVNGKERGYFVYNKLPQYGDIGLYVEPTAIDAAKLPPAMQKTLAQPEEAGISIPFKDGAMLDTQEPTKPRVTSNPGFKPQ